VNPHDEQKITSRDEVRKAREAKRASAAAFLPANDRFKQSYASLTYLCVIVATVAHFAVFEFFPKLEAADLGVVSDELSAIELPPEVKIPPPPEQIARPATPRVAAAEVSEDITIAPTTFEDNPVENLPPPPPGQDPSATPSYIARDVEPRLKNGREIRQLLERLYPPMLKEAGIGGRVLLWVFVDERGRASRSQVNTSSGYPALDKAAEQIVEQMEFSPAMNRDKPVGVWIAQPIDFSVTK